MNGKHFADLKNLIKNSFFLSKTLTSDERKQLTENMMARNLNVGGVLMAMISTFEIVMIVRSLIIIDLSATKNLIYFLSYVFLLVVSASTFGVLCSWKKRGAKNVPPVYFRVMLIFYAVSIILWSLVISIMDIRNGGSSIVYLTVIMGVGCCIFLYPLQILILNALSPTALGVAVALFTDTQVSSGDIINLVIFSIIVTVFALSKCNNTIRNFRQQNALSEKNDELSRLNLELADLSYHDKLTGVRNRWSMPDTLEKKISECKQKGTPMTVIMFDLDDFKQINDKYGHKVGDECLVELAKIMREYVCDDQLFRFGGEEFVITRRHFSESEATELAEVIRRRVEGTQFSTRQIKITISAGVYAKIPQETDIADVYLVKADQALFMAKNNGKNRVEITAAV